MNKRVYASVVLLLLTIQWCLAQSTGAKNNWIINEVYTSDSPKRYGLFLELYNPSNAKLTSDLYASTSRSNPYQYRLKSRSHFIPDWRKKGYRTCKISTVRFKSRTIKMLYTDSIFLFKRDRGYNFVLQDAFPVLWNDSLSIGRCGNSVCRFNIPTPGRKNQNMAPSQYMPRKLYRVSLLGGLSYANNTGYGKGASSTPSFGVKVQKTVNRRLYYTTTTASLFHQGYSFEESRVLPTTQIRKITGNYSSYEFWAGKEVGLFLTPRLDISCGAAIVLFSYSYQSYTESFINSQSGTTTESDKKFAQIENYQLPVLTFNAGLNYQLTSEYKIELFSNLLFRTFEKDETIYYRSFNIGISKSIRHKGRGYKEALLWK